MNYLVGEERLPVRVACEAIGLACATYYKKPAGLKEKDRPVMDALNQVVGKHGRWGFSLCFAYLRNQGAPWNHKRIWRIYKQMLFSSVRTAGDGAVRRDDGFAKSHPP